MGVRVRATTRSNAFSSRRRRARAVITPIARATRGASSFARAVREGLAPTSSSAPSHRARPSRRAIDERRTMDDGFERHRSSSSIAVSSVERARAVVGRDGIAAIRRGEEKP